MIVYVNGDPFFTVEAGDRSAPPVVFLHGFPFSHEMWSEQLPRVAARYRAIAYDLRGHGASVVGDGQYTIEDHVDDLFGLLNGLGAEKPVLVGLSMGGYVALRALERRQDRFRAAVLCDTKSDPDTTEGKLRRFAAMRAVKTGGSAIFADEFVKSVFAPETFRANPRAVERIKAIIGRTPPLSIAGTLLALAARTDTTPALSAVTIPTLIVVGELDSTTPPAAARALHERIAGSQLALVPHAAHLSNMENPGYFNETLMRFLDGVIPASA